MYAHLKKKERKQKDEIYDIVKLICTFINHEAAQTYFTDPDTVENVGFADDLLAIDPNIDMSKYAEYLEESI